MPKPWEVDETPKRKPWETEAKVEAVPKKPWEVDGPTPEPEKTTLATDLKQAAISIPNALIGAGGGIAKMIARDDEERQHVIHRTQAMQDELRQAVGLNNLDTYGKTPGVGGSLIQAVPKMAAMVASPATIPGFMVGDASNTATDIEQSTGDRQVANTVGAIEAASTAITGLIPGSGGPINLIKEGLKVPAKQVVKQALTQAATGAAGNVAQGYVTREMQSKVLEGAGYTKQAKAFQSDPENIAVDAILGAGPKVAVGTYKGIKERQYQAEASSRLDALKKIKEAQSQDMRAGNPEGIDEQQVLAPQFGKGTVNREQEQNNVAPVDPQAPTEQLPLGNGIPLPEAGKPQGELVPPKVDEPRQVQLGLPMSTPLERVPRTPFLDTSNSALPFDAKKEAKDLKAFPPPTIEKVLGKPPGPLVESKPASAKEIQDQALLAETEGKKPDQLLAPKTKEDAVGLMTEDLPKRSFLKGDNQLGAGPRFKGAVMNNPLVKWASHIITEGSLKAQHQMKTLFEPVARTWDKLDDNEKTQARTLAQWADKTEEVVKPEDMKAAGYSDAVVNYYTQARAALDQFHSNWNQSKLENNMTPVKYRYGYSPNGFRGDYTAVVVGKDGIVQGILKTSSTHEMRRAIAETERRFPDVIISKVDRRELNTMQGKEFAQALADIQKIIGNDPRLRGLSTIMQRQGQLEAGKLFDFDVHELNKRGVFGNEGNKFWKGVKENNDDYFRALTNYFEEGSINHNMIGPSAALKGVITDPEVGKKYPNTVEYLQQYENYLEGATGKLGKTGDYALDWLADLAGFGPNTVRNSNNLMINTAQTLWLSAGNARMFLAQMLQPIQTGLPMLMSIARDTGTWAAATPVEMARALTKATPLLFASYVEYKRGKPFKYLPPEYREAFDFARKHGLISWSEYEHVREYGSRTRKLSQASNALLRTAEATTRPTVFFAAYDIMKSSGMKQSEALEAAYNATQMAMVDYHRNQKPMMYGSLGEVGKQMGQLKTFSHSYVNLMQYFWKHDKVALTAMLGTSLALAGITGSVGYDLAYELYGTFFNRSLTDDIKARMAEWADGKMNKDDMDRLMYGEASNVSGLWLQPSLSSGNILPHDQRSLVSTVFPSASLAYKAGTDAWTFGKNRDVQSAKNLARDLLPSSVVGMFDIEANSVKRKDKEGNPQWMLKNRKGEPQEPRLSEHDKNVKEFGAGLNTYEYGKKQANKYENLNEESRREQRIKDLSENIRREIVSQEYTRDQLITQLNDYAKLTQNPDKIRSLLQSIPREKLKKFLSKEELLMLSGKRDNLLKHQRLTEE